MKYLKTYESYENWRDNLSNLEPIRQDVEDMFIGISDESDKIKLDVYLTTVQGHRGIWGKEGIRPLLVIEINGAEPGGGYAMNRSIYNEIKDAYQRALEYIRSVLIEHDSWLGYVRHKIKYSLNSRDTQYSYEANKIPSDFRKLKISMLLFEK